MQIITGRRIGKAAFRALIVTMLLNFIVHAQDPFVIAPKAYKLAFENDWVRVVRVHYAPNEKLPAHDHPKRQTMFVYLNDGGPVRFKHVAGDSGSFPVTRPATKAGAFRLAHSVSENHIVENLSELPSDFLQIELKTQNAETEKFKGRFLPDPQRATGNYRKVEFENAQVRITRFVSIAGSKSDPIDPSTNPRLLVALSPVEWRVAAKGGARSNLKLKLGETKWFEPNGLTELENRGKASAETLLIEFKTRPAAG